MKGNSLMEWFVKLFFLLLLLPFFVGLALQMLSATFQAMLAFLLAILPWIVGIGLLIGMVAGVSAGFVMRRRGPPNNRGGQPPPGARRIRRPRETRRRGEDE